MKVASLELCKELYEVSGWGWQDQYFATHYGVDDDNEQYPAYDLGYLLRKLNPRWSESVSVQFIRDDESSYWAATFTQDVKPVLTMQSADTPEDAACKLAIELFKQGILTK